MGLKHVPTNVKIYRHHSGAWSVDIRVKKGMFSDYEPVLIRVSTTELNRWLNNKCPMPRKQSNEHE